MEITEDDKKSKPSTHREIYCFLVKSGLQGFVKNKYLCLILA